MKSCLRPVYALCVVLLLALGSRTLAQNAVVDIAFFYSPTCPHCHEIMDNYFPPLQQKYGDAINIYYINVQEREGAMLLFDACQALNVPEGDCGGVPFMVIGDQYMLGSLEIPARTEGLVDAGLAQGGQNLSTLPLVWQVLQTQQGTLENAAPANPQRMTWQARFSQDLFANSLAVLVLVALVLSLLAAGVILWAFSTGRLLTGFTERWSSLFGVSASLAGALMALSIVLGSRDMPLFMALMVGLILLSVSVRLLGTRLMSPAYALIPPVLMAGLLVAGYLSYVEVGQTEAVCGTVGNCHAVQASPYAQVLGVPVGVIGVLGYALMLGAWSVSLRNDALARYATLALIVMASLGIAFSAYLTFLEPFVIGASCAWCLTSALIMLAVLWFSLPHLSLEQARSAPQRHRVTP